MGRIEYLRTSPKLTRTFNFFLIKSKNAQLNQTKFYFQIYHFISILVFIT